MMKQQSHEGRVVLHDLAGWLNGWEPYLQGCKLISVAFCSPSKSLTSSGLMENPLVGQKLKS